MRITVKEGDWIQGRLKVGIGEVVKFPKVRNREGSQKGILWR